MRNLEKRWTVWFAIGLMVFTSIPYYLGFHTQNSNTSNEKWIFSGFVFGVEDGNSYIAKMRLGYDGDWLFRTPYTQMAQKGLIAFLPYILLGKLAGKPGLHEQFILIFHWFRIGAGILMIIATDDFLSRFINDRFLRRLGLIITCIGGGLGWMMLLSSSQINLPLEFYSPEGFGFLSLFGLPHLALGRAFFLWTILEYLNLWDKEELASRALPWRLSVFWFLSGIFQPMYPGLLGMIIGMHWIVYSLISYRTKILIRRDLLSVFRKIVAAGIFPGGLLGYTAYKFLSDPYLRIWNIQNYLPSAPIRYYLVSYGWMIVFGILGLRELWKLNRNLFVLFITWLTIVPILIFIPISVQRRLIEGYWIVLVCLSMIFINHAPYLRARRAGYSLAIVIFLLSLPSSIMLLYGGIEKSLSPAEPVYLPKEKVDLFQEIENHHTEDKPVVLASYSTSNALPAYASVKVLIGHGPESAYGDERLREVKKFYSIDGTDEFRRQFLCANQIRYVVWGEEEQAYGDWDPATADYLRMLYHDDKTFLYEVILECNAG